MFRVECIGSRVSGSRVRDNVCTVFLGWHWVWEVFGVQDFAGFRV